MPFHIDLSNQTAIITGVTSGIGAGIAKMFARANANISGCGLEPIDHENVQEFIRNCRRENGITPVYVQTDVTDRAKLKNFVELTVEKFGSIDVVASNAGTNVYRGAENCSEEDWLANMRLNLESHWILAKLCKPHLDKSSNGVIIINSSSHCLNTIAGSFPYNIAKTGLKALIQSLTVEWAPSIRTIGIAPGFIDTKLAEEYFSTFPNPAVKRAEIEHAHPLHRLGTPEEIGGWFVFLSSQYAAFAGGQTYIIDGGRSAVMM